MTSAPGYRTLAEVPTGTRVRVALLRARGDLETRLADLGLRAGMEIMVQQNAGDGRIVVATGDGRIALGPGMTEHIVVTPVPSNTEKESADMDMVLRDLGVGDTGRVTGFLKGNTDYRQKLLAMGLTTGAEFTVARVAPLGDPVEISVRGFSLSLRKHEAAVVRVERTTV